MSFRSSKHLLAALALCFGSNLALAGDVTVSAAASLTNAFKDITAKYQAEHADARIELNFGASGALLQQMDKGAPVDVFASADQKSMDEAVQKNLIDASTRVDFVSNSLVLIAPHDSPLTLSDLAQLGDPAIKRIAIGNPDSVPVGRYTQTAVDAHNLWPVVKAKAINATSVRQALDYVARGEVDAGFVYATDAAVMADKVKVLMTVPVSRPVLYPIAVAAKPKDAAEAKRFVDYVLSPVGREILSGYGFGQPE